MIEVCRGAGACRALFDVIVACFEQAETHGTKLPILLQEAVSK